MMGLEDILCEREGLVWCLHPKVVLVVKARVHAHLLEGGPWQVEHGKEWLEFIRTTRINLDLFVVRSEVIFV